MENEPENDKNVKTTPVINNDEKINVNEQSLNVSPNISTCKNVLSSIDVSRRQENWRQTTMW